MSRPLVSIVTPSYNQAAFLEETIRSVLEQDYEPIEYVVVDGGSTDGSVEIIRRYQDRLAWWVSEPDGGQPQGLNKGFARSTGELMGFLNSDDTLLPGAISRLVAELGRDPEALVAYGDAVYVDEGGSETHYGKSKVWGVGPMARVATGTVMPSASLWRRRAWELAGPFDESYQVWFDVLFSASDLNEPRKGLHLLEKALAGIDDPPLLALAGAGEVPRHVETRWLGSISDDALLAQAYAAADVLAVPTVADALTQTAIESIACGTPCVAFDRGGVTDVVAHLDTGYQARFGDVDDLARGLETVLADAERFAPRCREVAEREFSVDVQVRRYVALYEEVLAA